MVNEESDERILALRHRISGLQHFLRRAGHLLLKHVTKTEDAEFARALINVYGADGASRVDDRQLLHIHQDFIAIISAFVMRYGAAPSPYFVDSLDREIRITSLDIFRATKGYLSRETFVPNDEMVYRWKPILSGHASRSAGSAPAADPATSESLCSERSASIMANGNANAPAPATAPDLIQFVLDAIERRMRGENFIEMTAAERAALQQHLKDESASVAIANGAFLGLSIRPV